MKVNFTSALCFGLVVAFNASAFAASSKTLVFSDARVIAPMTGTNVTAAYGVIKNESDKEVKLTISEVKPFKAAEVHETFEANGKSGMRKLEQIEIPAHQAFELKPGGNHIMLFDASRTVKVGESLNVRFMADGKAVTEKFKVVARDEKMADHMHMHHGASACTYTLNPDSVKVAWTAFKTMQKVGVGGNFTKLAVKGPLKAASFDALVKGLKVDVDQTSVDTGNPGRDQTLASFFFGKLKGSISGDVKKVSEADKTLVLDLSVNGHHHDVPMTITSEGKTFTAKGSMNILDFQSEPALKSLNEKCVDLHKGPDGVSKTWPDVELTLSGEIDSADCK